MHRATGLIDPVSLNKFLLQDAVSYVRTYLPTYLVYVSVDKRRFDFIRSSY